MPSYGSNDGYGRQQLPTRPSTALTAIGRRHSCGRNMQSLLSWESEAPAPPMVWGSSQQQSDVMSSSFQSTGSFEGSFSASFGRSGGFPELTPAGWKPPALDSGTGRVRHTPVQVPQGASRQALLSALEQANATIRQLNVDIQLAGGAPQAGGVARDVLERIEQLEAEQVELVKAVDDLGRQNASLRQQLRQQAGEVTQLREALQRRERDWQQRERERPDSDGMSTRLSRTISKPFTRKSSGVVQEAAL